MADRMHVDWAPSAIRDVGILLVDAQAEGGGEAAQALYDRLLRAAQELARKDAVSRILPELRDTGLFFYRELPLEPCSLFFRMTRTRINVLGVLDRRRDLRQVMFRRLIGSGAHGVRRMSGEAF
ncbi:MAG: type II toxin-antitoxin system RelE/ParE family toxin [bacterium]